MNLKYSNLLKKIYFLKSNYSNKVYSIFCDDFVIVLLVVWDSNCNKVLVFEEMLIVMFFWDVVNDEIEFWNEVSFCGDNVFRSSFFIWFCLCLEGV